MSRIANVLFPAPSIRRSPLAVIAWWESRRLTYNLVVGGAGLVTLAAASVVVRVLHGGLPPWPLVAVYALMANVCYSLGAPTELLLQRWLDRDTYGLGPALFRHGLVFSVGLTLLPLLVMGMGLVAWLVGLAR